MLENTLCFLPWFLILMGTCESRMMPALYAQTKTTSTNAKSLPNLSISVKCVSSILKPIDFKALNADSICQRSLYIDCPWSGLLNEAII